MIPVDKPGTPGELVHHGVKGMKWGVRSASTQAFRSQHPTRQARDSAIKTARGKVSKDKGTKQDEATALRLTTGEKAVLTLLVASGIGTLPIAAFTGVNIGVRRHTERQIRKGN